MIAAIRVTRHSDGVITAAKMILASSTAMTRRGDTGTGTVGWQLE